MDGDYQSSGWAPGFRQRPNVRSKLTKLAFRNNKHGYHRPRYADNRPKHRLSASADEWAAILQADPCRMFLGTGRRI